MQEPSALGRIVQLVRDLRKLCPWDAAQTPRTLRPYLVEEALELDQAIAAGDPHELKIELGDLFLHVAFQIVLAEEAGHFGAEDLTRAVEQKMWRRHPHLFEKGRRGQQGQGQAQGQGQGITWERHKLSELDREIAQQDGEGRIMEEIGDLLFTVVNLARKLGCDPRAALEESNRRFSVRFRHLEALAAERGIDVGRVELEVLDRLWEEVKE